MAEKQFADEYIYTTEGKVTRPLRPELLSMSKWNTHYGFDGGSRSEDLNTILNLRGLIEFCTRYRRRVLTCAGNTTNSYFPEHRLEEPARAVVEFFWVKMKRKRHGENQSWYFEPVLDTASVDSIDLSQKNPTIRQVVPKADVIDIAKSAPLRKVAQRQDAAWAERNRFGDKLVLSVWIEHKAGVKTGRGMSGSGVIRYVCTTFNLTESELLQKTPNIPVVVFKESCLTGEVLGARVAKCVFEDGYVE